MLELEEIKQVKYTDIDVEQGIEKDTQEDIELQENIPEATQVEEQEAVEISQNENNDRIFNNMLWNASNIKLKQKIK